MLPSTFGGAPYIFTGKNSNVLSFKRKLIGGCSKPSEKDEFVSWDDDIPNRWKNKKCSKPKNGCFLKWWYPQNHPILNRLFHYKPSSWGYPTFEETSKSQNEKFQGLEVRNHESVYHDSAACSVTLCRPLSGVDHCHSISLVPWFSQEKYIANIASIVGSSCPKKWLHSCAMCKSSLKTATLETQSGQFPSAGNSLLDFQTSIFGFVLSLAEI